MGSDDMQLLTEATYTYGRGDEAESARSRRSLRRRFVRAWSDGLPGLIRDNYGEPDHIRERTEEESIAPGE